MTAEAAVACRSCGGLDLHPFLDLGVTPLADALVAADNLDAPEERYPLQVAFCPDCALVQILEEVPPHKLFVDNYRYFSSYSDAVLEHSRRHATSLIDTRRLGPDSLVVELASNDGYLLRNFVVAGVPVLGIDPAPDQAAAANAAGVPTIDAFFGSDVAETLRHDGRVADVIIANNVLAHVPALNDFVAGMAMLLADDGLITIESPYVRELIDRVEFDTIYHEHYCYYSCTSMERLLRRHQLHLNDVEFFPDLHGGTLRWHVGHHDDPSDRVVEYLQRERDAGVDRFAYYQAFAIRVEDVADRLRTLIGDLVASGATVAGYGAAAKGATLLNYVGLGTDLVSFVVDRNPHKQGRHMPGTHQPIEDPAVLGERRPDYLLLLAWNFAAEIAAQQRDYLAGGGLMILPVPEPRIMP
ncbi:MAG: methyltransferase domain-containing protein [Acidimicrobiia bacterium]|nr:methyltransferase domain-containing protein [Acidimicrobiia bacterium]